MAFIFAPNNNDTLLTGTAIDDTIQGAGGNDTLVGLAGKDYLFGGQGNNSLVTGIATGEGTDTLIGIENIFGGIGIYTDACTGTWFRDFGKCRG